MRNERNVLRAANAMRGNNAVATTENPVNCKSVRLVNFIVKIISEIAILFKRISGIKYPPLAGLFYLFTQFAKDCATSDCSAAVIWATGMT